VWYLLFSLFPNIQFCSLKKKRVRGFPLIGFTLFEYPLFPNIMRLITLWNVVWVVLPKLSIWMFIYCKLWIVSLRVRESCINNQTVRNQSWTPVLTCTLYWFFHMMKRTGPKSELSSFVKPAPTWWCYVSLYTGTAIRRYLLSRLWEAGSDSSTQCVNFVAVFVICWRTMRVPVLFLHYPLTCKACPTVTPKPSLTWCNVNHVCI
jgi:hypothetical protein